MRKRILRHPAAPRYPALADDHYPQMIPARVIAALLLAAIMIALAIRA